MSPHNYRNKKGEPRARFAQPDTPLRSHIPSPYNFVPLSDKVSLMPSEWTDPISQDIPCRNGINGTIKLKLTAHTPLYIRNGGEHPESNKEKLKDPNYTSFYQLTPSVFGIPGSSIRGMLRNIVEIVSFSKMSLIDDYRYSMRDLNYQSQYTNKLTENVSGAYKSKVFAGWLEDAGKGEWNLYPCDFGRVEQKDLAAYHGYGFEPWNRQSGVEKTKSWRKHCPVKINCRIGKETRHRHGKGAFVYRKVDELGKGPDEGVVVLTGQPAGWSPKKPGSNKRKKHLEFVFFNQSTTPVKIPKSLKEEFTFVHSESGKPNDEWKFWKREMFEGKRVPVFYLGSKQEPKSMGLAMMYKLPYENTISDAIGHTSQDHLGDAPDFTECIFGRVNDDLKLKSRVWFKSMVHANQTKPMDLVQIILNGPKPTYYPNYIVQNSESDGRVKGNYKTLMDSDCMVRGWKRYPVHSNFKMPPKADDPRGTISTAFRPLPAGSEFTGEIVVHNLRPEELGALIWAIRLGGSDNTRHSIGMAKPYGFGQVSLSIDDSTELFCNDPDIEVNMDQCVADFVKKMETMLLSDKLKETPQIKALLDMASKDVPRPHDLEYPKLGRGSGNNHFVEYQKKKLSLLSFVEDHSSIGGNGPISGGAPDELIEEVAQRPDVVEKPETVSQNVKPFVMNVIEKQGKTAIQKLMLEGLLKHYPEKMTGWKDKFEKKGKGIWGKLKQAAEDCDLEI